VVKVAVLGAIETGFLVRVVVLEAGIVLIGIGLLLGHGAWTGFAERRTAVTVALSRAALQAALEAGDADGTARRRLAELSTPMRIEVLADVAPSLAGAQRQRLTALADDLGLVAVAETRCRSRLWWRRLQGARMCTLFGGGKATVRPLLDDRHASVRAQAVQWVVEYHDDEMVDLLLRMLDLDGDRTRFMVKDSLMRIGRPLTETLALHLSAGDGLSRGPALEVAMALPDPILLPAAMGLCRDKVPGVRALAAGVTGAIGGGAAVEVLMGLLEDEVAEVRAAAARALGRTAHWPAAAALAPLLGDQSWDVRQQAAVALRTLGSPGQLFLRQAISTGDPFAADAARRMMDLPDSVLGTLR